MAAVEDVWDAIVQQIIAVTTGLQANSIALSIQVGADYPGVDVLQTIGGSNNVAIAVFDRGVAQDSTQSISRAVVQTVAQPTYITSTLSNDIVTGLSAGAYAALAQANWNADLSVVEGGTSFRVNFSSPAPSSASIDLITGPTNVAGIGSLGIATNALLAAVAVPSGLGAYIPIARTSWNSPCWLISLSGGFATFGFATPAPVGGTLEYIFFPPAAAGSSALTTGAPNATVTIPNTATPYQLIVQPSWNTSVLVTAKTSTSFSVVFETPAPAGATLNWGTSTISASETTVVSNTRTPTAGSLFWDEPNMFTGNASVTVGLVSGQTQPNANDAISIILSNNGTLAAQVYIVLPGDTIALVASGLAALVNADPVMSLWVTASAVGPVVTLTNNLANALSLSSYVGNESNTTVEEGRELRKIQIIVWAGSTESRKVVGNAIKPMLRQLSNNVGVQLPDNSWLWVKPDGDVSVDDQVLADTYQRHFFLKADYAVTSVQNAYPVLAPMFTFDFL